MVFYVCHGRVQVDISGVQFSAGKGCVFQVPRGKIVSSGCARLVSTSFAFSLRMLISIFPGLQAIITASPTRMERTLGSSLRKAVCRWRMTSPAPDQLPSQLSQLRMSQQLKGVAQAVPVKEGRKASKRQEVDLKLHNLLFPQFRSLLLLTHQNNSMCGRGPTVSALAVRFPTSSSVLLKCCRSFLSYWVFVLNAWLWPSSV